MTPSQYRSLGIDQQLQVMNKYYENAGIPKSGFFTGDARQDASRAWALQLAPGNAKRLNYNDPNTVISRTNQASNISAAPGVVTVGSVQAATIASGGVRTPSTTPTPVQVNTVGYVAPNEEENIRDQQRTDSRGVDFADTEADVQRLESEMEGRQQDVGSDLSCPPPQQDFGNDRSLARAPTFTQPLPSTDSWYNQPSDGMSGRTFDAITGGQSPSQPSFMDQGVSPSWSNIDTSSDRK